MSWYTLMNKNYELIDVELSKTGEIISVGTVYDRDRLNPSCASGLLEDIDRWWESRCIPASRKHLKDIEKNLGVTNIKYLAKVAYGASLSDQYWIKPKGSDLTWDAVNFFHNDFSDEIGNVLVRYINSSLLYPVPDGATNGMASKKWKIVNGNRYLYKVSEYHNQEARNELFGYRIAKYLDCPAVPVGITKNRKEQMTSYTKCFVKDNQEYITAAQVCPTGDIEKLKEFAKRQGILDFEECFHKMIAVDFLIGNTDRHWGNFGFIRNVDTLQYEGTAPLFDFGSSMYYDCETTEIPVQVTTKLLKGLPDIRETLGYLTVPVYVERSELLEIFDTVFLDMETEDEYRMDILRYEFSDRISLYRELIGSRNW